MPRESFPIKRLVRPTAQVALFCVLPVLGAPERLTSPRLLAIAALYFISDLFQPPLISSSERGSADRMSLQVLLTAAILAQVLPIIEWAYFSAAPPNPVPITLGAFMMLTGAALRIWSIVTLGRFFSVRVEIQNEHCLVREGPYRWIRHPSYTGAALALIGVAVMLQVPTSLIVGTCALAVGYAYRIHTEEQALRRHFGEAFQRYERETKRLIPLVW